jgi:purine nucleosidase
MMIACWSMLLLCAPQAAAAPPRIIFDSDMSSDHDDVGDIAVLHGLAALGEIRIIGMMVSSRNYGTAQFMDAVNLWYGKTEIPIGLPPDIGGVGEYPGAALGTGRWPHRLGATKEAGLASGRCLGARELYRKLLASSPDRSVVVVTTGYLQNVQALLESGPDAHSPLNGMDLVRKKVRLLSCAGGCYPGGDEFNFRVGDAMPRPAFTVVNRWPTAAWYVGYDVGQAIYTGGLLPEARADSPIRHVYVDSLNEDYPYPSWGQIMVYYAARGLDSLWDAQTVGRNNADAAGSNWWSPTPDPSGDQEQGYLLEKVRSPVRESLDALMMLEPNDGKPSKPGQPSNLRAVIHGDRVDLQWRDNAFNETGFRIERGVDGVFAPIGSVGANVTRYSDAGLSSIANLAYRVKAVNATGESRHARTWVYSGWTEVVLEGPADGPLYTYYQPCHLRWARKPHAFDHVVLNRDSTHGRHATIDVDVGALSNQGTFHVYFLYQDPDHWYRLTYDNLAGAQAFRFEKRLRGTTTPVGAPRTLKTTQPAQLSEHYLHGIGSGSALRAWRIQVSPDSLRFSTEEHALAEDDTPADGGKRITSRITLDVAETPSLDRGLIGLGARHQNPLWENFRFTRSAVAGLAPAIAAQLQHASAVDGRAATFAVAASGSGPLSYRWKKDGTTPVGTNSPVLRLPAVKVADAGSYACTVINAAGSATSSAATLTVNPVVAPAVVASPADTTAPLGDAVRLTVAATGTPPLTYRWMQGSSPLGADGPILDLPAVRKADAGAYTCTVSNAVGSATSSVAVLTVVDALDPKIAAAAVIHDGGGTYGDYPNGPEKAFDGQTATFYDAKTVTGSYAGIDVGAGRSAVVTAIRYFARAGQAGRMIGGVFEGSNDATGGYTPLAKAAHASDAAWTTLLVAGAAPYRYLRYRGPDGGCCNVAEIQFHGRIRAAAR